MKCDICSREVLPHQCAHRDGYAVCFQCEGSAYAVLAELILAEQVGLDVATVGGPQ